MGKKDPRVDAYIQDAQDFAKPILRHLRALVHKTCPEVEETIKWRFPHFLYHGILCDMAAFKHHCTFGFWRAGSMKDAKKLVGETSKTAMGHFGRFTTLRDLPSDKTLVTYIREAMRINEQPRLIKKPTLRKHPRPKTLRTPAFFLRALKEQPEAYATFKNFSKSHKREYIEWLLEAKTEVTRSRRMHTALEWLSKGKSRNWKYM